MSWAIKCGLCAQVSLFSIFLVSCLLYHASCPSLPDHLVAVVGVQMQPHPPQTEDNRVPKKRIDPFATTQWLQSTTAAEVVKPPTLPSSAAPFSLEPTTPWIGRVQLGIALWCIAITSAAVLISIFRRLEVMTNGTAHKAAWVTADSIVGGLIICFLLACTDWLVYGGVHTSVVAVSLVATTAVGATTLLAMAFHLELVSEATLSKSMWVAADLLLGGVLIMSLIVGLTSSLAMRGTRHWVEQPKAHSI